MVQSSLDNKNWKEASEAMKKAGYSKEKQTQTFLSLKEYQEAINADPKELNTVVNEIYKNNDEKVVLDLELPTGTEEKINDELKIEKAIVSYDSETLASQLSFEENKDVLLRMGQAFLENNDMQDAQSVQTKLFGLDETKGDYLKSMIDLQTATDKVKDSQKKLDEANTESYKNPTPHLVNVKVEKGPFIIVSGHDLKDLEMLLKQTEGMGINIYTHGEMLPAHGYPELKKYPHLVGNYGSAWQNQQTEFDNIPGCILMTTNCLMRKKMKNWLKIRWIV